MQQHDIAFQQPPAGNDLIDQLEQIQQFIAMQSGGGMQSDQQQSFDMREPGDVMSAQ